MKQEWLSRSYWSLLLSVRWSSTSSVRGGGRRSPPTGATSTTPSSSPSGSPAWCSPPSCCSWPIASVRFRHREGNTAHYEPENKRLESWLTIAHRGRRRRHAGARPVRLEPVRHRSGRRHRGGGDRASNGSGASGCPAQDGKLGTVRHPQLVSAENPLGVKPDDPNGQDDVIVEAADLHLPVDKPVKMLLRSIDVLHDFYVPEFRAKMDMIPGTVTYFWFTPTRTGTFEVLCAELCGTGHSAHARHRHGRYRGRLRDLARRAADIRPVDGHPNRRVQRNQPRLEQGDARRKAPETCMTRY